MSAINISISFLLCLGVIMMVAQLFARRLGSRFTPDPIQVRSRRALRKRKY